MKDCSFWNHDWTKWESYEQEMTRVVRGVPYKSVADMQKRSCNKCGYQQIERVN